MPAAKGVVWAFLAVMAAAVADGAEVDGRDCRPPWMCGADQLTGDWFGARSGLARHGITLAADNTSFYFGNASGGLREQFDYSGHGDYVLNVDAGKAGLREGMFLKLRAEHRFGQTITSDVGAFLSPTLLADLPVDDSDQLYLTNVLLTQSIGESFAVFAGKFDTLDGDRNALAHGRGKTQFSNMAFCFNPIVAATVPYSTLGAGCVVTRQAEPILGFTVMNAVDTTGQSGFSELFAQGALLSAYVRIATCFGGMPGHQLLGGTWNSRTYDSIGDAYIEYPDLPIPTHEGSWSLYWNFDQYLVVRSTKPLNGWGVFGRAGLGDPSTNPLAWFLSFGLGGNVPLASRPADTFGVGWYYAGSSNQIGTTLTSTLGPIDDGQGVECFYNYQLTPAIRLTPDVQVILPAREVVDAALVVGLRAQIVF